MQIYTVLPRSNLTHAVRSRFVRFAAAVRAVRGYGSVESISDPLKHLVLRPSRFQRGHLINTFRNIKYQVEVDRNFFYNIVNICQYSIIIHTICIWL